MNCFLSLMLILFFHLKKFLRGLLKFTISDRNPNLKEQSKMHYSGNKSLVFLPKFHTLITNILKMMVNIG